MQGSWLVAADGGGIPTDFVNVWAAGRLVLEGHPAAAYDWPTHKAMEVVALGHPFDGYFGWHYPPTFLFVAAALALLPYTGAYVLWLAARSRVLSRRDARHRRRPHRLCARRRVSGRAGNFIVGQNGFLSAALLGGALFMLVESPILAGVCSACSPTSRTSDLLFPIALVAGGLLAHVLSPPASWLR